MSTAQLDYLQRELGKYQRELRVLDCVRKRELEFHRKKLKELTRRIEVAEVRLIFTLLRLPMTDFHNTFKQVAIMLEPTAHSLRKLLWIRSEDLYNRIHRPALLDWDVDNFLESDNITKKWCHLLDTLALIVSNPSNRL